MSNENLNDPAVMRERVLARARLEEEAAARGEGLGTEPEPELTHDFVSQCLGSNELGDGLLFVRLYRNRHAYVGQAAEWMYWEGHHWRIDDVDRAHRARADVEGVAQAYQRSADHFRKMAAEAEAEGDKETMGRCKNKADRLEKRVSKLRSESGRLRCLDFAKTNHEMPMAIRGDEIDTDPWALPMANGVLDLRTGKLNPGRPEDYLMKASPVEWRGIDEPCPEWDRFMLEIMDGDQSMVDFLQRAFGYGITGLSSEHIFLVLYGKGRNGKGIMTEVIQEGLGGQDSSGALAGPVQSEMLLDQGKNRNAAGPSPDIMTLRGLRMAFASETDEGQRFSPARVKWLSGGETLTGRYPHDKRNIAFTPTHLLCLLTNHNVLEQMDKDLGLVMNAPHGDSVPVAILPDEEGRIVVIPGKFDQAYQAVDPGSHIPVSSAAPTAFLRASDLMPILGRALTRRDRLKIGGRLYKPEEIMPDGFGLVTVRLQEQ